MYKYFLTASCNKSGFFVYVNLYYEIDFKLDTIDNIRKIRKSIEKEFDYTDVIIMFFIELKNGD